MLRSRKVFAMLLLAANLAASPAQACTKENFTETLQQMDAFKAVVRARVMEARVLPLAELGIACDKPEEPDRCEVLRLTLAVLENFTGGDIGRTAVYAPVVPLCRDAILPGWEYVFFLADFDGLVAATDSSFQVRNEAGSEKLAKLREWMAATPH